MEEDNPLIQCLPPATDYINYLTILEYNTNKENLPLLNDLLQDVELTSNIGWDLLQILLPLLPESLLCLETVARLGNPREVVLKATEALRTIEWEDEDDEDRGGEETKKSQGDQILPKQRALSIQQFLALTSMLNVLHSRIKTRYPSRFISTTFQAILGTIRQIKLLHTEIFDKYRNEIIEQSLSLVSKTKQKPVLPPRLGSNQAVTSIAPKATDPEAYSEPTSTSEEVLVTRLYRSFLTELLELYVCDTIEEGCIIVPGLAWSIRMQLRNDPRRTVSGDEVIAEQFQKTDTISRLQQETMSKFNSLALSHSMNDDVLFSTLLRNSTDSFPDETVGQNINQKSPEGIPLSALGSLYLLAARCLESSTTDVGQKLHIFPDHATIMQHFIGPNENLATVGSEPLCVIDAVLAIGLAAVQNSNFEAVQESDFLQYLQIMSLVSANTPHPSLRYYAHTLTSSVLASHPSDSTRSAFIMDTIVECPFENLRASAIGWLKDEIIKANQAGSTTNIFSNPKVLESYATAIFVAPALASAEALDERLEIFRSKLTFHLAALNFYYLLLSSEQLRKSLAVFDLHMNLHIDELYLQAFRVRLAEFDRVETTPENFDLVILADVLDRIRGVIEALAWKPIKLPK